MKHVADCKIVYNSKGNAVFVEAKRKTRIFTFGVQEEPDWKTPSGRKDEAVKEAIQLIKDGYEWIDLRGKFIGDDGVKTLLIETKKHLDTYKGLNLEDNMLTDEGANFIGKVFANTQTLQLLVI